MRIIKGIIIALTSFLLLAGCADRTGAESEYRFRAVVKAVTDDGIEATVSLEDGVHFGEYRILTGDNTQYCSTDGKSVARESIEQGDVIEVTYNGQVMRSFPPQVVATKIIVAAKSK